MTSARTATRVTKRGPDTLVRVKVVPYGKGLWGATPEGARSFINYVVGGQAAAKAEAERLRRTARSEP